MKKSSVLLTISLIALMSVAFAENEPRSVSGIYPHLTMFNLEGECGTGAVVPWAGRLWVVTYAPHMPKGSTDKLYEISEGLEQIIRPESIGGTPANRMIHRESNQLFIGPYAIDLMGNVRAIPYSNMFGRPTGNARHLTDPAGKIYCATMEEGLYEVDVKTLNVTELWADEAKKEGRHSDLPGYHGKGLYSGQGRIVYSNNGDHAKEALINPSVPSGVLAEWNGKEEKWTVVRRNQFTEVTGPGGIYGAKDPVNDPLWSIGWDHRSLILQVLDGGKWTSFRLPKSSHSYDGAHGWNTEWPRIRDVGQGDYVMTMHGMFWKFPGDFSSTNAHAPTPMSSYLKVIGDFCGWKDRVVLGCDDTAKAEFLNKRKAAGKIPEPQSQSNLWFVKRERLSDLGPAIGRGAVWMNEEVAAGNVSDPFGIAGWQRRGLHLKQGGSTPVTIIIEASTAKLNGWVKIGEKTVLPGEATWLELRPEAEQEWVRLRCEKDLHQVTAAFSFSNEDKRSIEPAEIFSGLAALGDDKAIGGIAFARGNDKRDLHFLANTAAQEVGLYSLDSALNLNPVNESADLEFARKYPIPAGVLTADAASVVYTDDKGARWRLPRGSSNFPESAPIRVCREVATERNLFNAYGTFFELPAENAGGFIKARAISTHNLGVMDYCSYRGLFVMTGVRADAPASEHIVRSNDGKAALWVGAIDDIWKAGKPRGHGGPWLNTIVEAEKPSEPYLATGYDKKSLALSHTSKESVKFRIEADITGNKEWANVQSFVVPAGKTIEYTFPEAFTSYWFRIIAEKPTTASAQFTYE